MVLPLQTKPNCRNGPRPSGQVGSNLPPDDGAPLLETQEQYDLLPFEALDGDGMRLEWCGGVFHPRDQAAEQGEWIFHH
jgi:hypothetical protein